MSDEWMVDDDRNVRDARTGLISVEDFSVLPGARDAPSQLVVLPTGRASAASAKHACRWFGAMLGASASMQKLYGAIRRVAPTDASVLLLGESGTGKELAAQTIHDLSPRCDKPFLPINCGAIAPQLIESEIFGHEKGSFTGAERQHRGYFERASGGTLFLDEITEMPIELQVKLLRVLESGSFMRIGGHQQLKTDVRIVAASNRDPQAAVAEGALRLDLYHRLNVFPLEIPPLRERRDDIALLARHFIGELNQAHHTDKSITPEALSVWTEHDWPGNVRELRNYLQRAFILADCIIDSAPAKSPPASTAPNDRIVPIVVGTSLADADRQLIFATLKRCGGVKKQTADILGISLKTLYNRLEEYARHPINISVPHTAPPRRRLSDLGVPE